MLLCYIRQSIPHQMQLLSCPSRAEGGLGRRFLKEGFLGPFPSGAEIPWQSPATSPATSGCRVQTRAAERHTLAHPPLLMQLCQRCLAPCVVQHRLEKSASSDCLREHTLDAGQAGLDQAQHIILGKGRSGLSGCRDKKERKKLSKATKVLQGHLRDPRTPEAIHLSTLVL